MPAAPAPLGSLLETQSLQPHPSSTGSESAFTKTSQIIYMHIKLETLKQTLQCIQNNTLSRTCQDQISLQHQGGLPWWLSGKESTCQCRRHEFDPWVRKIPWRRKWQPISVSLPGNPMHRGAWRATVHGVAKELDLVTKQQNQHHEQEINFHHFFFFFFFTVFLLISNYLLYQKVKMYKRLRKKTKSYLILKNILC